MEKRRAEDELTHTVTTKSKRQRSYKFLETFKADSTTLHDRLYKDLEKISDEVELKENQLQILSNKLEQTQNQIEQQTAKLKATENEAGEKEKELDLLRNQIKSEENTLTDLRTAVKNTRNELELKKQEVRVRSSVFVKHEQQHVAAESELFDSDARMLHELSSASLDRDAVSVYLRNIPNPAKFVVDLLEGQIRDRRNKTGLQELVVQNLVMFFEELSEIEGSNKPQQQLRAKTLATMWKGKIIIEAPSSSLEALAFLLFILAFDLKSLLNAEETALLATSVFHYEQGPKVYHLLGLKPRISEFVGDLIRDHQYIPAVRIICLLKRKDLSATTLLVKEITNLRQSVLEKVESKDVGKLRAIVELVADYKLDIDLPCDLIAKVLLQRENLGPPVLRCAVETPQEVHTSSSNPEAASLFHNATRSSVDLLVPKREFKPFMNPTANGRF